MLVVSNSSQSTVGALENHQAFLNRLQGLAWPVELVRATDRVYELAKSAHRSQFREGEQTTDGKPVRYFEHCRAVALIFLDELREEFSKFSPLTQAVIIMAALGHDIPEDTALFGNPTRPIPGDSKPWRHLVAERLDELDPRRLAPVGALFQENLKSHERAWESLSTIVLGVTKLNARELCEHGLHPDDPDYKKGKVELSVHLVREAGPVAVLIKAADRLANLRTAHHMEPDWINKKVQETRLHFLPLFREFSDGSKQTIFSIAITQLTSKIDRELQHLSINSGD